MTKLRIGAQFHPQHTTYASFAEGIRQAEALGADTIWTWDHFFPLYGDPQGNHFEGWTLLTAMATLTQRAEVGCLVACNTYRNPALLANMAKTIDHISNGRLIFGIGAGWFERDYKEYGYEFGTAGDRLRALGQALPLIKERWQVEVPTPVRNPIPICIGGGGERVTLKLVAQHADIWNGFGPADKFQHKNGILNNWCDEVERDPATIERSVLISSDELPKLDAYVDAGATHLILGMGEPWDFQTLEQMIRWRDSR